MYMRRFECENLHFQITVTTWHSSDYIDMTGWLRVLRGKKKRNLIRSDKLSKIICIFDVCVRARFNGLPFLPVLNYVDADDSIYDFR